MRTINCTIKGVAPLLQHRFPTEEHGENKKRGKKHDVTRDLLEKLKE